MEPSSVSRGAGAPPARGRTGSPLRLGPRAGTSSAYRLVAVVSAVVLLAACSSAAGSASGTTSQSAVATATVTPTTSVASQSSTAGTSASELPTAAPTAIDPCQLLTQSEASQLGGDTLGAGTSTTDNNTKLCTYGSATPVIVSAIVAVAPDVATAQAAEAAALNDLKSQAPPGTQTTELPNFAPGTDAILLTGSQSFGGKTLSATAIYMLKGTIFVAITDLAVDKPAATTDAIEAQAQTSLGRLP